MKISHARAHLWLESGILSNLSSDDGNYKTLRHILEEVKEYSLKRAVEKTGCKKSEAKKQDEYKNTIGWMGEVLCEFWLRTFGHRMDLTDICDTSANKFQRGYDFTARVIIDLTLTALIQIKMQSEDRAFTRESLFTFFDEVKKTGTLPRYTILMVPTAELPKAEMLSWKKDFKKEYSSQLIFVGLGKMDEEILSLPTRIQDENPNLEFFIRFRECLNASCKSFGMEI